MKSAQRAGTLRNGVAVTDADVVTGYASQRLLLIGIVTDRECKPLTFGLFDNVACLNDSDADMDTDTCTDSWLSTENILQPPRRLRRLIKKLWLIMYFSCLW